MHVAAWLLTRRVVGGPRSYEAREFGTPHSNARFDARGTGSSLPLVLACTHSAHVSGEPEVASGSPWWGLTCLGECPRHVLLIAIFFLKFPFSWLDVIAPGALFTEKVNLYSPILYYQEKIFWKKKRAVIKSSMEKVNYDFRRMECDVYFEKNETENDFVNEFQNT